MSDLLLEAACEVAGVPVPKRERNSRAMSRSAKALGVTRVHLSYVVHGRRKSARLLERYHHLLKTGEVLP